MKTISFLLLFVLMMAAAPRTPAQSSSAPPPQDTNAAASTNVNPADVVALVVAFDGTPLPDAIRTLASQAQLNIQFDPRVENPVDPTDHHPLPPILVTDKWKNVTSMQALLALMNKYQLQIVHDPDTPIVTIAPKDPKALEPLVLSVVQLMYSDPSNVTALVKLSLGDRDSVQFDTRTHQLILRAAAREMPGAMSLISNLDSPTRQVLIEAKIVETTKDITSAKGVDWTGTLASQHVSFGNGLTSGTVTSGSTGGGAGTTTTPGGRTVSTGAGNIVSNTSSFLTSISGIPSSAGGLSLNTANGFSPSTAFLNADGVAAVLSFLNTDADTKDIAFPRTVSLDGVQNQLMVIQNVPVFEQQQSSGAPGTANLATVQPNYEKKVGGVIVNEVGVKLTVTPRIAGPTNVLLTLEPEISKVDALVATSTLNGQVNTSPIFDRRRISTTASVPSGYTLVLGGLDNDMVSKTYTKVPLFGDLPGVGGLFRSNNKNQSRDTILIFVTPTIIQEEHFHPSNSHFLDSQNEGLPPDMTAPWDSGVPYDWTKPSSPVQPVYKP